MFYSGIADEAGRDIATQIRAHEELGWNHIELRSVDGTNVCLLDDQKFDPLLAALKEAKMKVSCLASPIGDWSHSIRDSFLPDANILRRAVKRSLQLSELGMKPFIRVMSYPNDKDNPLADDEWRDRAIKRVKGMVSIADRHHVVLAHENCSGWGGINAANNVSLLEAITGPSLGELFDTGNPPTYGQQTWDWFERVRTRIVYVHIKDALKVHGKDVYTMPGEGHGCVEGIIADLLSRGYDGGFSIEPHLEAVIHTGQKAADADALYQSYVNYGRRLMKIVDDMRANSAH